MSGFDDYVQAALADFQTPGIAVAVIKDGQVVLARGYGNRRAGEDSPVDEHTIFPIASVTKVFTATCVALLVEEGKLKWNDPVVEHLPEFELHDPVLTKDVRIEDLLSHRVGIETADLVAYRGDCDRAEIIRRLRFMQPVAPFRSRFGYHNHFLTTAGEVLERVCGDSWEHVLRSRLLTPLGMDATCVGPRELEGRGTGKMTRFGRSLLLRQAKSGSYGFECPPNAFRACKSSGFHGMSRCRNFGGRTSCNTCFEAARTRLCNRLS